MNLVVLLCAVDSRELGGTTGLLPSTMPLMTDTSPKPVLESYSDFKRRVEEQLNELLDNSTALQLLYIRVMDKAAILLRGLKKKKSEAALSFNLFKSEKELLTFVKSKAQDFDGGKVKEVFFFLHKGYLLMRKWSKADYIVVVDPDVDQSHQGRLLAAQATTIIRKAATERRDKRLALKQS